MAHIAYLLLCHKDAPAIVAQARRVTAAGDFLAIHFDGRSSSADYAQIEKALRDNPRVAFAPRRVKCGWGQWSLVEATLLTARAALDAFPRATHVYMLSGDCMPIKSAAFCRAFLEAEDCDYIEHNDFLTSDWIRTGFREERLVYRHWFNERGNRALFYASYNLQRVLGLKRRGPSDLRVMIGSQWWCLRRETLRKVLSFCDARRDVRRFFATTWVPDETFFQTVVHHVVPRDELRNRSLTFLIFSDYGMPVSFYDDQYDLLVSQGHLFARKISPEALNLKARLGDLYSHGDAHVQVSDEGRRLFHYLTGRGRVGRRFGLRAWERESTIGQGRTLLIVTCKKWHVAKRLADRIAGRTDLPCLHFVFDELEAGLPDLGGTETTLAKRGRHRRSLLRMVFDRHDTDRLLICLDPAQLALILDFASDRSETRVLDVACAFSDGDLEAHARRVGLAGEGTAPGTLARLIPTIRHDLAHERETLAAAGLAHLHRMDESATPRQNAAALAAFLDMDATTAHGIAASDDLFAD